MDDLLQSLIKTCQNMSANMKNIQQDPKISLSLSSNLQDGNITALKQQNQHQIAHTLQNMLHFLNGSSHMMMRMVSNGCLGEVIEFGKGFADVLINSCEALSKQDIDSYAEVFKRAQINLSLNYGQILDSLDGEQNNAVNVLNEIFSDQTGGGDPSLFVDSPVSLVNSFHFLLCEKIENQNQFYNIFEYWIRIGTKGYPPAGVLLKYFVDDDKPFIPSKPIIFVEIYAIPSTRKDFLQIKGKQNKREEIPVQHICDAKQPGYYFVQNKSIEMNIIEKLPAQFYIPNNIMHIADVFQELKLAPLQDRLFEHNTNDIFSNNSKQCLMQSLHKYFSQQINYLISLQLSRTVALQQIKISNILNATELYQLHKQIADGNISNIAQLGLDALQYLDCKGKITAKTILKLNTKEYVKHTVKAHVDSGMTGSDKIMHNLRNKECVKKSQYFNIVPEVQEEQQNDQQKTYHNSQFEFMKQVYNFHFEAANHDNIFMINYDKQAMLSKRYSYKGYFCSFLPEVISIPNVSLHPYATNKDLSTLQIDLGCYQAEHRIYVFLMLVTEFPQLWTQLQQQLLNHLNLEHYSNPNQIQSKLHQQLLPIAYRKSGKFLSIPIYETLQINKILITARTQGEDPISIVQNNTNKNEEPNYTLVLHIVNMQNNQRMYMKDICNKEFPQSLKNEFQYFFGHNFQLPDIQQKFTIESPRDIANLIISKLSIKMFTRVINFARRMQQSTLELLSSEFVIKTPKSYCYNNDLYLETFSELIQKITNAEFGQSKAVNQHLNMITHSCSVNIVGVSNKTQVLFGTNQSSLKVQYGKMSIVVDNDGPINQYLRTRQCDEFWSTNYHLAEKKMSLLTLTEKFSDHSTGILDGDILGAVYIPNHLLQDPKYAQNIDRSKYMSKCCVIIKNSNELLEKTLIIELNQTLIEKIVLRKQIQLKANANLPFLLQKETTTNEIQVQMNEIVTEIVKTPQFYELKMHALRCALHQISCTFQRKTQVYCLLETFSGKFSQVAESLQFAQIISVHLAKLKMMPVNFDQVSNLVFMCNSVSQGEFPLNMLLVGPVNQSIPPVIGSLVQVAQFLTETEIDEIIARQTRFENVTEFIHALVPATIISSQSFNTFQELAEEEEGDMFEDEVEKSMQFEKISNEQVDKLLDTEWADAGNSVYISDQSFYGYQVSIVCIEAAWKKLLEVVNILQPSLVKGEFEEQCAMLINTKCFKFWKSLE
ncbi:Conserved_hypothetical protein [Hexamita inflata]|uniref:Uncharacterized protein n=1 Tax=Hexamita inflata TaxID=28002 RepID=A0AA86U803_9EUKA|nr:Conserved hypothetical protein [Hexamita inflata]